MQYVDKVTAGEQTRYIFGELNQNTISFTFRVNYTINPELSIEYYGQPFISDGKYSNYKEITDSRARTFENRYRLFEDSELSYNNPDNEYTVTGSGTENFTFSNPDFNFRQFRSNLVVRWEYLPGSTLYLVWSQGRTNQASNGVFDYKADVKDLFNTVPHNIFLIKLSYWFSL